MLKHNYEECYEEDLKAGVGRFSRQEIREGFPKECAEPWRLRRTCCRCRQVRQGREGHSRQKEQHVQNVCPASTAPGWNRFRHLKFFFVHSNWL